MMGPDLLFQQAHRLYLAGRYHEALKALEKLPAKAREQSEVLRLTGLSASKSGSIEAADKAFARAASLAPGHAQLHSDWAEAWSRKGNFDRAEQILRAGIMRNPGDKGLLAQLGFLKREADDRDGAALVFDHMLKSWPSDPQALQARALVELERGGDARLHYQRALKLSPKDRQLLMGAATAIHRSGKTSEAIRLLEEALQSEPNWLKGLQLLARLRWEVGDTKDFAKGYARAIDGRPEDISLWAAFLGVLASSLRFDQVLSNLPEARRRAGAHALFDMMEAQALSETGQHEAADRIFHRLPALADPTFVPIRLRALLRTGRAEEAARLGEQFTESPAAPFVWPLLGLAWRVIGDPKWQWLERHEETVAAAELSLTDEEWDETSEALRLLHTSAEHPYDQSVRGGTQTTGNLFDRTEPAIARLRSRIVEAVAAYIAKLPELDPRHPFLGRRRGRFRFAGSWSIRLRGEGHHVSHVHPQGWISSALYLEVPPKVPGCASNQGFLVLGEPPPELGLDLPALGWVEPKRGRLALFPSIMWHGTVPFRAGERLTVAFDVVPY